jgi:hypothetical protein
MEIQTGLEQGTLGTSCSRRERDFDKIDNGAYGSAMGKVEITPEAKR